MKTRYTYRCIVCGEENEQISKYVSFRLVCTKCGTIIQQIYGKHYIEVNVFSGLTED